MPSTSLPRATIPLLNLRMNAAYVIKRVFIARLEKFLDYSKRRTVVDRTCPTYVILRVCQKFALLEIET